MLLASCKTQARGGQTRYRCYYNILLHVHVLDKNMLTKGEQRVNFLSVLPFYHQTGGLSCVDAMLEIEKLAVSVRNTLIPNLASQNYKFYAQ